MIGESRRFLTGWHGDFSFWQTPLLLRELDSWLLRRIRIVLWKPRETGSRGGPVLEKPGVTRPIDYANIDTQFGRI